MPDDPSYHYSILLGKAYRSLRTSVYECLEPYQLIPTHWSLIGIVYRSPQGITLSDVAVELGVKLPLVTVMVDYLEKKGLIDRIPNKADGRSKLLVATKQGSAQVVEIEAAITRHLAPLLDGVSLQDMQGFQAVLMAIITNEKL